MKACPSVLWTKAPTSMPRSKPWCAFAHTCSCSSTSAMPLPVLSQMRLPCPALSTRLYIDMSTAALGASAEFHATIQAPVSGRPTKRHGLEAVSILSPGARASALRTPPPPAHASLPLQTHSWLHGHPSLFSCPFPPFLPTRPPARPLARISSVSSFTLHPRSSTFASPFTLPNPTFAGGPRSSRHCCPLHFCNSPHRCPLSADHSLPRARTSTRIAPKKPRENNRSPRPPVYPQSCPLGILKIKQEKNADRRFASASKPQRGFNQQKKTRCRPPLALRLYSAASPCCTPRPDKAISTSSTHSSPKAPTSMRRLTM